MDTTLRDGEQTSGVSFAAHEKLSIAQVLLKELGVNRVEVASARVSEGEFEAVRRVAAWAARTGYLDKLEVLGFVDGTVSLDWIESAGCRVVNLLCKGSYKHVTEQLRKTPERHIADIRAVVEEAVGVFEKARLNLAWYNRLLENREVIAQQLDAMAYIMEDCAKEYTDISKEEGRLLAAVKYRVKERGIVVHEAHLYEKNNGRLSLQIRVSSKWGNCVGVKDIAKAVSEGMRRSMAPAKNSKTLVGKEESVLSFEEETVYHTLHGVARLPKDGAQISGDNFSFLDLEGGQTVLTLSDGMGSGIRACKESEMVIELIEKFLETGFQKETAIRMMNSAMVMNDTDGMYSTVDMAAIEFPTEGRQVDRTVREMPAAAGVNAHGVAPVKRQVFNLTLTDGTLSDRTRFVLNENAKAGYDMATDAGKFMSPDASVPQLYTTEDGVDFSINERPMGNGLIALAARFGSEGMYTLSLDTDAGAAVYLVDKLTGTETDLRQGGYTFQAEAGTVADRFLVKVVDDGESDGSTTGVDGVEAQGVSVSAAQGRIQVVAPEASAISVYSVDGKAVGASVAAEASFEVRPGVYVVTVNGASRKVTVIE